MSLHRRSGRAVAEPHKFDVCVAQGVSFSAGSFFPLENSLSDISCSISNVWVGIFARVQNCLRAHPNDADVRSPLVELPRTKLFQLLAPLYQSQVKLAGNYPSADMKRDSGGGDLRSESCSVLPAANQDAVRAWLVESIIVKKFTASGGGTRKRKLRLQRVERKGSGGRGGALAQKRRRGRKDEDCCRRAYEAEKGGGGERTYA